MNICNLARHWLKKHNLIHATIQRGLFDDDLNTLEMIFVLKSRKTDISKQSFIVSIPISVP